MHVFCLTVIVLLSIVNGMQRTLIWCFNLNFLLALETTFANKESDD